jgi:uridine nucleosidase
LSSFQIHGQDGLAGTETTILTLRDPVVNRYFQESQQEDRKAIFGIASACKKLKQEGEGRKLNIAATGSLTNIGKYRYHSWLYLVLTICSAIFIKVFPELLEQVEQIVFMGGAVGGVGNRGAMSEFNMILDPEAAQIVIDAPVKTVMIVSNFMYQNEFR